MFPVRFIGKLINLRSIKPDVHVAAESTRGIELFAIALDSAAMTTGFQYLLEK